VIFDLYIGRKATGVNVRPDKTWRGMWRIHQGENVSDMVNKARAKEAAISWARPRGLLTQPNGHTAVATYSRSAAS